MDAMYLEELSGAYDAYLDTQEYAQGGEETFSGEEPWRKTAPPEEALERREPETAADTFPEGAEQTGLQDVRLAEYQLREQDDRLLAGRETGSVYRKLRDEVLAVVDYCRKNGHPEVDVQSAFQAVAGKNLGKIYAQAKDDAQREAVQKMQANEQATPGPLSGGVVQEGNRFERMSDREFDRYLEMAYRGDLQGKAF